MLEENWEREEFFRLLADIISAREGGVDELEQELEDWRVARIQLMIAYEENGRSLEDREVCEEFMVEVATDELIPDIHERCCVARELAQTARDPDQFMEVFTEEIVEECHEFFAELEAQIDAYLEFQQQI